MTRAVRSGCRQQDVYDLCPRDPYQRKAIILDNGLHRVEIDVAGQFGGSLSRRRCGSSESRLPTGTHLGRMAEKSGTIAGSRSIFGRKAV